LNCDFRYFARYRFCTEQTVVFAKIAIQIFVAAGISLNMLDIRSPSLHCGSEIAPVGQSP